MKHLAGGQGPTTLQGGLDVAGRARSSAREGARKRYVIHHRKVATVAPVVHPSWTPEETGRVWGVVAPVVHPSWTPEETGRVWGVHKDRTTGSSTGRQPKEVSVKQTARRTFSHGETPTFFIGVIISSDPK